MLLSPPQADRSQGAAAMGLGATPQPVLKSMEGRAAEPLVGLVDSHGAFPRHAELAPYGLMGRPIFALTKPQSFLLM